MRQTKSLNKLVKVFEETEFAISVVSLVKRFKSEMSKTTVYRILERLEKKNVIHSFIGKDGERWVAKLQQAYPSHVERHPHFQCKTCGNMECVPFDFNLPTIKGYEVEAANLVLIGTCEQCL